MRTKPKAKIDIARVEELAGMGMSLEQIAADLGICYRTLLRRQQKEGEKSELSEAIKRGRAKRIEHVIVKLHELINEKNPTAIIFFLKTQAGWKETTRQEITGENGAPLIPEKHYDFSNFTPEQATALIREAYAEKAEA